MGQSPKRLAGCTKLSEFVKIGRIGKAEAEKLIDSGSIVIKKTKHPNAEEVIRKMDSMFEIVGVGVDWYEIERQKKEYAAQVAEQIAEEAAAQIAAAKTALENAKATAEKAKATAEKAKATAEKAKATAEKAKATAEKAEAEKAKAEKDAAEKAVRTAKKALDKGLSPEDAAEIADLSLDEVLSLIC